MKIPDVKGMISLARDLHEAPQRVAPREASRPRTASDRVELSSQGQQVQQLASQRTDQVQRSRMVEELKWRFQQGQLETNPELTARAMLDEGLFDDLI